MDITRDRIAPCGIRPRRSLSAPSTQGCPGGTSSCRAGCTKPRSTAGRISLKTESRFMVCLPRTAECFFRWIPMSVRVSRPRHTRRCHRRGPTQTTSQASTPCSLRGAPPFCMEISLSKSARSCVRQRVNSSPSVDGLTFLEEPWNMFYGLLRT